MPLVTRFVQFFKTHGFTQSWKRIFEWLWLDLLCRRFVLYVTDISEAEIPDPGLPADCEVAHRDSLNELEPAELQALIRFRGEKTALSQFEKRFGRGARVWFLRRAGKPIGLVWSIRGTTMEPYFFPLTANDIHLFDNEVFQEFRGKGWNRYLMLTVFKRLQDEGNYRVHGETKVRNRAKRASNRDLPFRTAYGIASKYQFLGRTVVFWSPPDQGQGEPA